jgi:Tol biopolymer transport system component
MLALKFLAPELIATKPALGRLVSEAKAASALNHPHIVTIYEVVHSGDDVAIAMELVEGESLRKYCGKPQPIAQLIRWGRQIAQALAAAHERNIVHRDIKPENLMARSDGYVKVLDFGLARQLRPNAQSQSTNASGTFAGTLNYIAPEQTRAEAATSASDVFSLGIVLFELVTGTHPFLCDSPIDTAYAIAHSEPKPPCSFNRDISPALNSLLLAMLANNPGDRPSAAEVDRKLSQIESATLERQSRGLRWLVALGLTACIAAGATLWLMRERIFLAKEPTMSQLTTQASENRVTAAALSPDGKSLAFAPSGGSIRLRRMSDGFTQSLATPPGLQVTRVAWFTDGSRLLLSGTLGDRRGGIWVLPVHGGSWSLIVSDAKDGVPSPDGTRIAATSMDNATIWIVGVTDRAPRPIRVGGSTTLFSSLIWSPDSKRIAYQRGDYAPAKDRLQNRLEKNYQYSYESLDAGTTQVAASAKDVRITSACALQDGRILFLSWVSPELIWSHQLWELQTDPHTGRVLGPPRRLTHSKDVALSSVSASSDGRNVSVVWLKGWPNVYIAGLMPASPVPRLVDIRQLTFTEANNYPHAWTPDNRTVIFESDRNILGDNRYQLYRQNIDQTEAEPLSLAPGNNVLPQLSPDGKWVLYRSDQETGNRRLMRVAVGGGMPEPLRTGWDEFRCGLQASSRCVLRTVENNQFVFHELDPVRGQGRELARTAWIPTVVGDWDLSPDGSQVAIPNHDPRDAKIRLVPLSGRLPGVDGRTITLSGLKYLDAVVWTADGRGWYVSVLTSSGTRLMYADLQGRTSDLHLESMLSLYAVPSPDGRHIAFPEWTVSSNAWLFGGL